MTDTTEAVERECRNIHDAITALKIPARIGVRWQDMLRALAAERDTLAARVKELEDALREIASQKKTDELETEYDVECADFEGGYDACIDRARAALTQKDTDNG
jgi:hypothetical protein